MTVGLSPAVVEGTEFFAVTIHSVKKCCIPKAMVGWERRMWEVLAEKEVLNALEHFKN
jgi:hypothetical protein